MCMCVSTIQDIYINKRLFIIWIVSVSLYGCSTCTRLPVFVMIGVVLVMNIIGKKIIEIESYTQML